MQCPECIKNLVQRKEDVNTYDCPACCCTWRIHKIFNIETDHDTVWGKLAPTDKNNSGGLNVQ